MHWLLESYNNIIRELKYKIATILRPHCKKNNIAIDWCGQLCAASGFCHAFIIGTNCIFCMAFLKDTKYCYHLSFGAMKHATPVAFPVHFTSVHRKLQMLLSFLVSEYCWIYARIMCDFDVYKLLPDK